jgi:hypothetical protein
VKPEGAIKKKKMDNKEILATLGIKYTAVIYLRFEYIIEVLIYGSPAYVLY